MGFYAATANCVSSWHSILRLWRGPSPRAYSLRTVSHGLSCRYGELCLFEALYPAPLARPFSKGLLAGDYLTWAFMPLRRIVPLRGTLSSAFGAPLLQGPTRRELSHMGFHAADGLLFAFSFRKVFIGAPEAFFEGDLGLPLEIAFRFGVVQGGAVDVALSGFIIGGDDLFA